jgi:hypothetical protein
VKKKPATIRRRKRRRKPPLIGSVEYKWLMFTRRRQSWAPVPAPLEA